MKTRGSSGVTLIEVLIAVSLLSLLSVAILTAMRVGLNALEKANTKLLNNRKVSITQSIVEQQIQDFMPVVALAISNPGTPPVQVPFFHGEPQAMRFVSTYSLQEASRGMPQILEFSVIVGDRGEGVRLVVNEHPYAGPLSAGAFCRGRFVDPVLGFEVALFRPIETGPQSFVLADRLQYCRFSFLEPVEAPVLRRWVSRWVLPRWPLGVRIEMAPLDPDPARLRPITVTASIHVNRYPIFDYVD